MTICRVVIGSENYEKYRPSVIINNLTVNAQMECFYATDTIDITLNKCNGTTNLVDYGKSYFDAKNKKTKALPDSSAGFMESCLAASYSATLTVNGGVFTSTKYGASIYSTGGEIDLNNVTLTGAEYAYYIYAPSSNDSVGNSTLKINNCTLTGKKFVSSDAGYNGYKAEVIGD